MLENPLLLFFSLEGGYNHLFVRLYAGEFPGVNLLETALKFRKRKKNLSSLVYVSTPLNVKLGIFTP